MDTIASSGFDRVQSLSLDQRGQPFTYDFVVITEKGVTTSSG